ncbi:MAG: hypothetical protein WDN25_30400 [Acetobacteraceae bacterium]
MIVTLIDAFERSDVLFPAVSQSLPASIAYTNEAEFDEKWSHHVLTVAYATRTAHFSKIVVGRLPANVTTYQGDRFILGIGGDAIFESIP